MSPRRRNRPLIEALATLRDLETYGLARPGQIAVVKRDLRAAGGPVNRLSSGSAQQRASECSSHTF